MNRNNMIKNYKEYITEKLTDNLSGFDEQSLKQEFESGKFDIFKYIEICNKYKLPLPTDDEIIKSFEKLDPNYILFESCKIGLMQGVIYAFKHEINNDEYINASLRAVIYSNNIDILKYMIKHKVNIHYDDDITFYNSVRLKRFEMVKLLIDYNISEKALNDSLLIAINLKQYEVVKFLIEHGADVNYNDDQVLNKSISEFNREMIEYLLEHGANISNCEFAIYNLIDNNEFSHIEYLLNIGAEISDDIIKYVIDGQFYDIFNLFIKYHIIFSNDILQYIREADDDKFTSMMVNAGY